MTRQIASVERSFDELQGSTTSSLPCIQNDIFDQNMDEKLISRLWNRLEPYRRPYMIAFYVFTVYTIFVVTAGVLTVCFATLKLNKTCQLDFERTMKSSIISSSQPRSVAAGDFNNDQQIDLVVANSDTNTIGIFLAIGNQTFANQQTYSTGSESRPYSVAVSDFNHDNYLDIAVANYGTHSIGIFSGNGNGTFNDQNLYSLGSSRPLFIATGDFNRDNQTDVAVINYGTNSISILLGYYNGSFQDQQNYPTGYDSIPYSLAVGDFNNDDRLDISVANYGTNNIGIFLGDGNGTFIDQQTYTTYPKSNPTSIAVGDFNNDNQLDIAVSNNGTSSVGIFLGYGNGTFETQISYSTGFNSYPQYISVSDLDNDNASDIIVVDSQNDHIYILPGYGDGRFPTIATYDTPSGSHPVSIVVANFNNNDSNNRSGIAVVNYDSNDVLVLIDYSIKSSARQTDYNIMSWDSTVSVAVSDFNNDSIPDVVYFPSSGSLHIRMGLGNGLLGSENVYSVGYLFAPQYICVGDVNNDNRMDVVTANTVTNNVGVVLGRGDGTFDNMTTYSSGIGSSPWWVALGDVNNDDRLDIISANTGSNTIGILLGNGDGTFASVVIYPTVVGSAPHSVAVGDFNNDKNLDFVVANNKDFVILFLGHGNGTFSFMQSYTTNGSANPTSIAVGYFNNDNYLDVVVANTFTNNIGVFLGYGDGTLSTQTSYSTGTASNPYYIIVTDLNNDNISDIVATNFGSDEVVFFYGNGNGSFALTITHPTGFGSSPYGIATAGYNNNKQLELIVALSGNGYIAVLTEYNAAELVETSYFTGSAPQPFSIATGDFNNDDRPDIVVANSGTDNLAILINLNNGTFDAKMNYLIGAGAFPRYVITCDINQDNQLDLVSVNSGIDSISVIEGYGNGSFANQRIYSTGNNSNPYAVASGDLNNDNRVDLVTANEGTDSISIFFGFNYTSFQNQKTYSSVDSLATSDIAVSDFNNDQYLDLAATFYWSNTIGVLLGYGNGNFTDIMTYSTGDGSGPWGIAVGDFNNDNHSDIVATTSVTNNVGLFLGYGNGSFTTMITYPTGKYSAPEAVAVNDFNNDSQLDIVVANSGTNSVGVLLGYGDGNFSAVQTYSTGYGSSSTSVTVGDFNNDGNFDIAVANYGTQCVGVLLGYGDGTFGNLTTFSTGLSSFPYWVTVGDFNNDTILDIATANWNAASVGILIGHGNGTFAPITKTTTGPGSMPIYVAVSDFNDDNILDIAVVNSGTSNIVILFGFGDGSFLLGTGYSTGVGSDPFALAIGDFNNDARLDIAVANNYADNIGIFLGYESQPYANAITYNTDDGSQPHSVAISNLNNDGYSDIVIANYGTDNVGILLGNSNKTFENMKKFSTGIGSGPSSIAIANLNNDTHLDIIVSNSQTDNIAILFGYGNGTFATAITYQTGTRSQPYTVAVADFNNDKISDIAVANSGINDILILYGRGDGTFADEISYSLGYDYRPYSIAVNDFNQDNWTDIAIACFNTDDVETLIKMCLM